MNDKYLSSFLELFEHVNKTVLEQFKETTVVLQSVKYKPLSSVVFQDALSFLNARDELHFSCSVDDGETIDYYSGDNIDSFLKDLNGKLSIVDEEEIAINLKISKNLKEGVLSIYQYHDFISFLGGLSVQTLFQEFNTCLKQTGYLIFENQMHELTGKTKTIWIVNKGYHGQPENLDRFIKIDKAKTSCHYNFLSRFEVLAEDFKPIFCDDIQLSNILNRLTLVASVVYLYDITNLRDNYLDYKLNGYKSISGTIDTQSVDNDLDHQYYRIYDWVYESGNFVDKIGLARNIISLHLDKKESVTLKGDPFLSIQSSYKVYEKQNIKQYIEIRNKVSDQLLNFHDRANKIVETLASGFQKNILALITFYISAIILKILNKDTLTGVFTFDAAVLSTAFILCSFCYFFALNWEIGAQKKRFKSNYDDVKKRYTDLLNEQDINRVLNNDREFKSDVKFVEDKTKIYAASWFICLLILFLTTWLLYFFYNSSDVIKIARFIILLIMFVPVRWA